MKKWIFRILFFLLLFAALSALSFYCVLRFTSPDFVMKVADIFSFLSRESYFNAFVNVVAVFCAIASMVLLFIGEALLKKRKEFK